MQINQSITHSLTQAGENVTETPIRTIRKTMTDGHDILIAVNIDKAMNSAMFTMGGLATHVGHATLTLMPPSSCIRILSYCTFVTLSFNFI